MSKLEADQHAMHQYTGNIRRGLFFRLPGPDPEAARTPQEQARNHHEWVRAHARCDPVIDPSRMTSEECAVTILQSAEGSQPDVFRKITWTVHQ